MICTVSKWWYIIQMDFVHQDKTSDFIHCINAFIINIGIVCIIAFHSLFHIGSLFLYGHHTIIVPCRSWIKPGQSSLISCHEQIHSEGFYPWNHLPYRISKEIRHSKNLVIGPQKSYYKCDPSCCHDYSGVELEILWWECFALNPKKIYQFWLSLHQKTPPMNSYHMQGLIYLLRRSFYKMILWFSSFRINFKTNPSIPD